ncbi:hypothetical protein VB734_09750 [Synechococcus sp. BA-124 BA4]|jgi:hypothetical protein|uniref:hypothetical protein n=1 Tax=unclassified Synechococcus TaxID=2626047 RepID=UPI0018CF7057|nr:MULTISPECIES: hypothetical protein [unclassified Synechococcus]MEA5400322.1 hypothetical protein [Synechococcus sp. BA-124 BA4]QPN57036.1 hypothetical protein I1E95_02350 [Synechococcus sp. CBW1107]CAK6694819.1 hypothetical protein BBFGKLBO_01719 [Synechococcus sp. CBW1107]
MSLLSTTEAKGQRTPANPMGVMLRLATVALAGLADLTLAGAVEAETQLKASASTSQRDEQVSKFCLATVSAAFQAARKVPPPGLGTFACSCFVDQVNQGAGLDVAQSTCRQRTMARYSL